MPLITEELSVWDIGLRWAGHDPDRLWLRLPLAAKDNFRLLMEAILSGEIICNTLNRGKLYNADVVDACVRLFREKGFTFP